MYKMLVKIEDLGKISSAEIILSKMTFFIGDNNSGKSYLMSLLYGLMKLSIPNFINRDKAINLQEMKKYTDELLFNINNVEKNSVYTLSKSDFNKMVELLNKLMNDHKEELVQEIFGEEVQIGKLWFEIPYFPVEISGFADLNDNKALKYSFEADGLKIGWYMSHSRAIRNYFPSDTVLILFLLEWIFKYAIDKSMKLDARLIQGSPVFFPVSRTGFMLTYKTLMAQAIDDQFYPSEKREKLNMLTKPERDFLRMLSQLNVRERTEKQSSINIVKFIQNALIDGSIKVSDLPISDVVYSPNSDPSVKLPLYVSSGVVTELTPVLLHLLYGEDSTCLMIEEPEMCLHPELQQKMAQMLTRMANSCFAIMATTHSDIIMQHINNMICLNRIEKRVQIMQKLGYIEDDLIDETDINVYQFVKNPKFGLTDVKRLELGEYGFELPTFINSLDKIYEHTRAITEE